MDTDTEKQKARWIRQENGTLRLEPAPEIRDDVTLGAFEAGCELLGLDPDALLRGESLPEKLDPPGFLAEQAFLGVALKNSERYNLLAMEDAQRMRLVTTVAAHWIQEAARGAEPITLVAGEVVAVRHDAGKIAVHW